METKVITHEAFVKILAATAATAITLHFSSDVRFKKGNPFKNFEVRKVTIGTYDFGHSYETLVNEAASTTTFKAEALPWGSWVSGAVNKVIVYNGKYYLRYYNEQTMPSMYYTINMIPVGPEQYMDICKWSSKPTLAKTQANVGLTEKTAVRAKCLSFDNIYSAIIDDTCYVLRS